MSASTTPDLIFETKLASARGLVFISISLTILCLVYTISQVIYILYIHPLHSVPGPTSWLIFPLLRHLTAIRGLYDFRLTALHAKYGPVVRVGPKEVSFITAAAWKDIYGRHYSSPGGHGQLQKLMLQSHDGVSDIIRANDADHTRFRRSLAHAFSEKALRDQEPLMKTYIDLMIAKLTDVANSGLETDMVKWYNLCTFDIIGDLAFGESFDGLTSTRYHFWVDVLFKGVKMIPFLGLMREYPLFQKVVRMVVPKAQLQARKKQVEYTRNTVTKRINNEKLHGRGDLMDAMLRHRGTDEGLSDEELVSNSRILIVAGSETTATLLSGVTYHLLRTPAALKKVTDEVRSKFAFEDEITFANATARLPYMLACLDEALRCYPPVPTGLVRITPPGPPTNISGYEIPAGYGVSVHQLAAYSSALNFHNPEEYVPERWLPDPPPEYQSDEKGVVQPFSVGPRNCIGRNLAYNEMRLILARILWGFDLELCEESGLWKKQKSFVLWEKPALMVRLKVREGRWRGGVESYAN